MTPDFSQLQRMYADRFHVHEVRPGILEVQLPVFAEDGDPYHIYLRTEDDGSLKLSDLGTTVMKLSYNYNLETESRERALEEILRENRVEYQDGEIYLPVSKPDIYPEVLHFAQVLGKISSMEYWRRAQPIRQFEETLRTHIFSHMQEYGPRENVSHLGERDDYKADYGFFTNLSRPTYLFAVSSVSKAGDTNACLLAFQATARPFFGIVVYGEQDITRKYQRRLAVLADKIYLELEDFIESGASQMRRYAVHN